MPLQFKKWLNYKLQTTYTLSPGEKNCAPSQVSQVPMTRVRVVTKTDAKEETPSKPEKIPWQSQKRSFEYRELIKKEWLKKHTDHITKRRHKKISETLDRKEQKPCILGTQNASKFAPPLPASVSWNQARQCSHQKLLCLLPSAVNPKRC